MPDEPNFRIDKNTRIQLRSINLSESDLERLEELNIIESRTTRSGSGGQKGEKFARITLNLHAVREISYEYDILQKVASRVETQILECFRSAEQSTLTTAELSNEIDRPKSSIIRSLTSLTEKNQITKVQNGVYRRKK